jgi:hypothetical protein
MVAELVAEIIQLEALMGELCDDVGHEDVGPGWLAKIRSRPAVPGGQQLGVTQWCCTAASQLVLSPPKKMSTALDTTASIAAFIFESTCSPIILWFNG